MTATLRDSNCARPCRTVSWAGSDRSSSPSLSLMLNAVVLWTAAAVAELRAQDHEIRDEDVARLSPLKHKNLNALGRYWRVF
ncbi:transposase [Streptomyces sp. ET3-23]|nr:transposase [Streptomyces sp. ET3-23]MCC2280531.1 transposase [Streptomyces sp. ET3-23]